MTDASLLCAVRFSDSRVVEMGGDPAWTIEPPAEVRKLRRQIERECAALREQLAGEAVAYYPMERPAPMPFAVGGVAYM